MIAIYFTQQCDHTLHICQNPQVPKLLRGPGRASGSSTFSPGEPPSSVQIRKGCFGLTTPRPLDLNYSCSGQNFRCFLTEKTFTTDIDISKTFCSKLCIYIPPPLVAHFARPHPADPQPGNLWYFLRLHRNRNRQLRHLGSLTLTKALVHLPTNGFGWQMVVESVTLLTRDSKGIGILNLLWPLYWWYYFKLVRCNLLWWPTKNRLKRLKVLVFSTSLNCWCSSIQPNPSNKLDGFTKMT